MGPEGMREGELYFAVLQEDGTPGEWQKWEGFRTIEITEPHEQTVGDVIRTLSESQLLELYYLVGMVFTNGALHDKIDIYRYKALLIKLNPDQRKCVKFFIETARKEWEKKNG